MILVDTNLLVYATDETSPHHEPARDWWAAQLGGTERVGLAWGAILGYLRILTNPRILKHPRPIEEAWSYVDQWMEAPCVWIPLPTPRHASILRDLLVPGASANLVPDAHLAALAIEHGLTLCSTDRDFGGFPKLKWVNPLRQ